MRSSCRRRNNTRSTGRGALFPGDKRAADSDFASSSSYCSARKPRWRSRATAIPRAEEFRDIVKERLATRKDGKDIGDIIDWFLRDADPARGRKRADYVIAQVAQQLEPAPLVTLICDLRDNKQWWQRPPRRGVRWDKTLRDYAALCVGKQYQIEHMLAMITAAQRQFLPAVLRLVPEWLSRRQPVGGEVARLVRALEDARCDAGELIAAIEWSAAESQWHVYLCGHGIQVAARGKDNSFPADHEPAIQLRQFLDRSA